MIWYWERKSMEMVEKSNLNSQYCQMDHALLFVKGELGGYLIHGRIRDNPFWLSVIDYHTGIKEYIEIYFEENSN